MQLTEYPPPLPLQASEALRTAQHEADSAQLQAEEAVRSSEAELAALRVGTRLWYRADM